MDARKAKANNVPEPAAEWVEEPLTAADIAACEAAEAAVARGEWLDGAAVMAELRAMAARHRARAAQARGKSTA
jgi:hypothetical protein